jgi:hypothetical protein
MDEEMLRGVWRSVIEGEGGHCPVCDRWGRIYGRNLNKTMAHSLIWLCSASTDDDGWVDVPNKAPRWLVRSNQLSTLRWWDLVVRKNTAEDKNKYSGLWKPTIVGRDFVHSGARIPLKVFTYNNNVEAKSVETVAIHECFDEYFDYQAVMNDHFPKVVAS